MDPRAKLLSVMLITIVVFIVDKLSVFVLLVLFLIFIRFIMLRARVSSFKTKYLLNLSLLAAFIILIQTFFGNGLIFGLMIVCRVFSLMLIFPVFTQTTPPYELAAGLNALGFPYRIAFIITTAFNQVPHFAGEARLIMDAQKLRGLNVYDSPFFFGRFKAYAGICLPLVLSAMRKAQVSSIAMDSRAFGVHNTRTWLDKPKMKPRDYLFILGCCIFAALLLVSNYVDFNF